MQSIGDLIRSSDDVDLSELFSSWFDCKHELCPIAIIMECNKSPNDKSGCKKVWKEFLSQLPPEI